MLKLRKLDQAHDFLMAPYSFLSTMKVYCRQTTLQSLCDIRDFSGRHAIGFRPMCTKYCHTLHCFAK